MLKRSSSSIVRQTAFRLLVDALRFMSLGFQSRSQLAAQNLFLRKQLALYRERRVKPRRADDATRITLVVLSQLIDWRAVLTIVEPDTLIRWHRKGFRLSPSRRSCMAWPKGRTVPGVDIERRQAQSMILAGR